MTSPPHTTVPPPYRPAPFLMAGPSSFLTREELVLFFEDFYASLEYVNTAPQLVFERLIGNLSVPVHAAIDKARLAHTSEHSGEEMSPGDVPVPALQGPAQVEEEVLPRNHHVIRSFHTQDGQWDASPRVTFTKAFTTAGEPDISRIPIALTSFHIPKEKFVIASARITAPHASGFGATLSSLSNGISGSLNSASCSWLELDVFDTDMQCGSWSLSESHKWDQPQISTTRDITFPLTYDKPPQVLVWLKHVFTAKDYDRSLRLLVSNITAMGFTLHVNSLLRNNLYGSEVTWLACSARRQDVHFGSFQAEDGVQEETRREGYVAFPTARFKSAPRVIAGVTGFHTPKRSDLCIAVDAAEVTREGLKWRVDGMGHTDIASVECSYIALA